MGGDTSLPMIICCCKTAKFDAASSRQRNGLPIALLETSEELEPSCGLEGLLMEEVRIGFFFFGRDILNVAFHRSSS